MSDNRQLPPGWCWATLPELLTEKLCNGISVKGKDTPPGVPALKLGAMGEGGFDYADKRYIPIDADTAQTLAIRDGDFFVARGNGSLHLVGRGTLAQAPPEQIVFPDTMIRLRLADVGPLRKYIALLWQSSIVRRHVEMRARTTAGIYKISQQDIEELQLPLPPSNEQRRIVAKIEELLSDLDAGVAALERAKANLKRYRAAVLKAAVEGRLTESWRAEHPLTEHASKLLDRILAERRRKWAADQLAKFAAAEKEPPKNWRGKYVEPTTPDTASLPELPEGWCWATLGQLLHGIEGGKSFKCQTRPANHDEWGVIKVSAMTWGTFLEAEQKAIPPDSQFDLSDEIKPNDLLLSRSNTSQLVGATVLVGDCRPRLLLSDKSLRLKVSTTLNRQWLHKALSSSVARHQLSAMATGTSDSMRNVSQEKIESVLLPLPPVSEQEAIVTEIEERVSVLAASQNQVDHDLLRAARLRQSILKQAFEGKLVPQDPTDEPARAVLERLRLSAGKMNGTPRTRTRRHSSPKNHEEDRS